MNDTERKETESGREADRIEELIGEVGELIEETEKLRSARNRYGILTAIVVATVIVLVLVLAL